MTGLVTAYRPVVPGVFLLPNCCGGLSTLSLDPLDFCADVFQALLLAAVEADEADEAAAAAAAAFSFINFPTNLVDVGIPVATSITDNFRPGCRGLPGGGSGVLAVVSAVGEAAFTVTLAALPAASSGTFAV